MRSYEFIDAIIAHCGRLFPRSCRDCGRAYRSLRDHFEDTGFVGAGTRFNLVSDAKSGVFVFANCACGASLAIDREGVEPGTHQALREALAFDARETQMSTEQILAGLRIAVRQRVLAPTPRDVLAQRAS